MRWLVLLGIAALPVRAVEPAEPEVSTAIRRGVEYLRKQQQADGRWRWPSTRRHTHWPERAPLATATVLYALAVTGVPKDDEAIRRGIEWTRRNDHGYRPGRMLATRAASMLLLALARIDKDAHAKRIRTLVRRLEKAQNANGLWSDRLRASALATEPLANPASHAALSALWMAERLGAVEVDRKVWERTYRRCAKADWESVPHAIFRRPSNLFGLVVSAARVGAEPEGARRGLAAFKAMRVYKEPKTLGHGLDYLHLIECAATVTSVPDEEWYTPRARFLLDWQYRSGGWPGAVIDDSYPTAVAVLFLSRTLGPVAPKPRRTR